MHAPGTRCCVGSPEAKGRKLLAGTNAASRWRSLLSLPTPAPIPPVTNPSNCPFPSPTQVLIKKQAERLQPGRQAAATQQQAGKQQQRGLTAKLKLPQPTVAATRPQGSPAACLTLALPAPGWREQ